MPKLTTRQKDALVWFNRHSPDAMGVYDLADRLAGGHLQGQHPGGAQKLIETLSSNGYIEPVDNGSPQAWGITESGRHEAKRIQDMRRKRQRPLVLSANPPTWATMHLKIDATVKVST
jgi:hypothetical protein